MGQRIDAHILTLDGANESFGNSVALRALDRRRSRLETDLAGEAASVAFGLTNLGQTNEGGQAVLLYRTIAICMLWEKLAEAIARKSFGRFTIGDQIISTPFFTMGRK